MDVERYLQKAILQIERKCFDGALESLNMIFNSVEDDIVSFTQAHCLCGELLFITQSYSEAYSHFMWIEQNIDILEEKDDLLNEEINRAYIVLDLLAKFSLITA